MVPRWTALTVFALGGLATCATASAVDFEIRDEAPPSAVKSYPDPSIPVWESHPRRDRRPPADPMWISDDPRDADGGDGSVAPAGNYESEPTSGSDEGLGWESYLPEAPGACGDGSCESWCNPAGCQQSWFVDLWMDQGFTGNYDFPDNNFNLPVTFNDRANEYMMNQLYLSMGRKVLDCGDQWGLGGRVDLLYGTDYFFTTALGLETRADGSQRWNSGEGPRNGGTAALYGLAMPQLYGEVYVPVLSGINFKLGHFYTTLGYESVMAPSNFFYSHSYCMQYGEPKTNTGVLASMPLSRRLNGHFAYTTGWDSWEMVNDEGSYVAGLTWNANDISTVSFAMQTGREDLAAMNNRFLYTLVMTQQLTNRFRWVIQQDFGSESLAEVDVVGAPDDAKWYGVNNYFYWDVSNNVTWGLRAEWFRDQDNARVLGIPSETLVKGGNYVGLTSGLNYRMTRRFLLRPELRWDWSDVVPPGGGGMFNDFTEDGQITAGFDLIFQL